MSTPLWDPWARTASGLPSPALPEAAPARLPRWAASARSFARSRALHLVLLWGGLALVAAHALALVALRDRPAGLASNLLQLLLDGFVIAAVLGAAVRGAVFPRAVWFFVAAAVGLHAAGQAMATFYDFTGVAPFLSPWWSDQFLFFWVAPLVVASVADPLEPRDNFQFAGLLDSLQVLMLGIAWHYSVLGDAAAWRSDGLGMEWLSFKVRLGRDLFVLACLLVRALLSEFPCSRRVFRKLALFFLVFAAVDIVYMYCEARLDLRFGTGMDILWSLPRWVLIFLAVRSTDSGLPADSSHPRRNYWLLHVASLVVPLLILFLAFTQPTLSHFLLGLLVASTVCAGARVVVTQVNQEQAVRGLTRSRNLLSAVIEGTSQAIYLKDLDGRFVLINSALARLLGRETHQVLGRRDEDVLLPSLLQHARESDRRVMLTGEPSTTEVPMEVGLESRTLLSTKAPYFEAQGKIGGILGVVVDITPLKQAQRDLVLWKERCESVLRASRHVMYELDPSTGAIHIDRTFDSFLGYTPEELPQRSSQWRRLIHEQDRGGCYESIGRAVRSGKPFRCEYRVRGKSGGFHHVVEHGQILPGRDGRRFRIAGFVEDVTESRLAAERMERTQRLESLGTLAAGVAHDFNNLLTVINGYSELLLDGRPVGEAAEAIRQAGERAAGLVRQLLAFSRQQQLSPHVLDLNESVLSVYRMLRRLIPERIEIRLDLDRGIGNVKADPGQIEQMIMNLAVNARDAMPGGGALTIATSASTLAENVDPNFGVPPGEYLVLSIADNGVGIPPDIQSRIFDPFFTTKELGRGTGLGLATVHGIVTQSGGHVRVTSEMGRGTTFEIWLPSTTDKVGHVLPLSPYLCRRGQEHILLVEDDPSVRRLVTIALSDAGFEVTGVDDPQLALSLLRGRKSDLLISDLVLPGINGRELWQLVQQQSPSTRVVFITGHIDDPLIEHVVSDGLTVLQKPFSSGRLLDCVRRTLDS